MITVSRGEAGLTVQTPVSGMGCSAPAGGGHWTELGPLAMVPPPGTSGAMSRAGAGRGRKGGGQVRVPTLGRGHQHPQPRGLAQVHTRDTRNVRMQQPIAGNCNLTTGFSG